MLSQELGDVSVKELSSHLEIKMPSVTSMMKRMADKGWVRYESYKPVKLTATGKKEAALVIRKHRLTEMFLVEKMGFRWDEVHAIAEQIEHVKAPEFFLKMDELLGFPKFDPHGSPIPDKEGKMTGIAAHQLSTCKASETLKIIGVTKSSEEFLQLLNSKQIRIGLFIHVLHVEPFDGSMTLNYEQHEKVQLSRAVCERLLVERL